MKIRMLNILSQRTLMSNGFKVSTLLHSPKKEAVVSCSCRLISSSDHRMNQKARTLEEKEAFYQWQQPEGVDLGFTVSNTYGSLGKKKDREPVPLVVADPSNIKWYACGPTVYDSCHVGHASSYLRFDLIRRILTKRYKNDMTLVMGITDVDDKIVARSNLIDQEMRDLTHQYETEFYQDLSDLNILPAHSFVRVSDLMPEIIAFINRLISKGQAYATSIGNVWFDHRSDLSAYLVPTYEEWGDPALGDKKNARDFALWKAAKPGEPYWTAPWGHGRPGWHIECSTITTMHFGSQLDIHSGAVDLKFPHHECEIFQCHAYHDTNQWCNYFLHSGHLSQSKDSGKMSKSFGKVVTIQAYLKSYSPDMLRLMCMGEHWCQDVLYTKRQVKTTKAKLEKLQRFAYHCQQYVLGNMSGRVDADKARPMLAACQAGVDKAVRADFRTDRALVHIERLVDGISEMMKEEVLLEEWKEPDPMRNNDCMVEVMRWYIGFFRDLGFLTIESNRYKPGR